MVKLGLDIDDPQSNKAKQLDPQKASQASIENCIRALVHATQCRDPRCKQPSCIKMKKVLTHTKECKLMLARKWNQCTICTQFVLLCISHARNCNEDTCRVPLCTIIKKNLKEQRKQQAQDTNRFAQLRAARMASMLMSKTGNGATTVDYGSSTSDAGLAPQQSSSQNSAGKNPDPFIQPPYMLINNDVSGSLTSGATSPPCLRLSCHRIPLDRRLTLLFLSPNLTLAP